MAVNVIVETASIGTNIWERVSDYTLIIAPAFWARGQAAVPPSASLAEAREIPLRAEAFEKEWQGRGVD